MGRAANARRVERREARRVNRLGRPDERARGGAERVVGDFAGAAGARERAERVERRERFLPREGVAGGPRLDARPPCVGARPRVGGVARRDLERRLVRAVRVAHRRERARACEPRARRFAQSAESLEQERAARRGGERAAHVTRLGRGGRLAHEVRRLVRGCAGAPREIDGALVVAERVLGAAGRVIDPASRRVQSRGDERVVLEREGIVERGERRVERAATAERERGDLGDGRAGASLSALVFERRGDARVVARVPREAREHRGGP